jgi:hypothetical protein
VPAVAGGGGGEPVGERGQQLVAGLVAAGVVDLLELVEVEQGDDGGQLVGGALGEQSPLPGAGPCDPPATERRPMIGCP